MFRPYMFDQALQREGNPLPRPLDQHVDADVCIVGGGYTGLWTAIELKQRNPELQIVLIDKELCGYGASGSNGGCLLTLSTKLPTMCRFFGESEALRLVKASEQAVTDIQAFCQAHQIDADLRLDGALYMASNRSQVGTMNPVIGALQKHGINSWSRLDLDQARRFGGTQDMHEGFFSPVAGSVQPGLLVRGMARVARKLGIRIYEQTPMKKLEESCPARVITPLGSITARKVVLAMNAWMASQFPQFARSIAVVSSDILVTEPCGDRLDEIGLEHGATVCDSRTFVHYYHRTADGRLMFGKGGNTFAYGSRMIPSFFESSRYEKQLQGAIQRFFPSLADIPVAASWNGGSDRSVSGFPFFGKLNSNPHIFYGFGYSGNGVAQSYLGGKILASLVLEVDDPWSRAGFVGGPRGYFPPEPIRWLGSIAVRNAIRRKEQAEDAGRKTAWLDRQLAKFARAAVKTDKQ
ncbi:MAG: FAD-dependent oxidoreductase [Mariniblastus sp.]|nr:FAD-dependent oxidoreductase [Mariniblastus sp.]